MNAKVSTLRVNGDRLWSDLMEMARIGVTPNGGCNRQALTDADVAGRNLLSRWAEAAGCHGRIDAIGNLFVRRSGYDEALRAVFTGSHLGTQPTGGKFDGVYGVLAGLERSSLPHPVRFDMVGLSQGGHSRRIPTRLA